MKNLLLMGIALFILPLTGQSAKYAGEFLTPGVGGRALGMGGAYVALGQDASAGYWNPAGMARVTFRELTLMHAERFGDLVNYDYAAYLQPMDERGQSVMAISLIRLGVNDIPFTEDLELVEPDAAHRNGRLDSPAEYVLYDENKIIWKSDTETALFFSYGRAINERFTVGGSVKLVRKAVGSYDANGFGFDLAMQYRLFPDLNFGLNLQDATTTLLLWDSGSNETIAPTLKTGLAWTRPLGFVSGVIAVAGDVDARFEGRNQVGSQISTGAMSFDFHFGIEYLYRQTLAFRIGPDSGKLSTGAGLILNKLRFDYAFVGHNDLGDTHRISGSIRF